MSDGAYYLIADLLLWAMYAMLFVAIAAVVVSLVRSVRSRQRGDGLTNGIAEGRIAWMMFGFTVLLLVVTFLLGSSEPLLINGHKYADTFWLKATDMLLCSSVVLGVLAVAAVVFGASGASRRLKPKSKR